MISRARFSLTTLLLLTTAVAGGMAIWRVFVYEPPTHKIPLYERAPATRGRSIEVGPNRVGFRVIARNDRDGSIHYDQQRTSSAKLRAADESLLAKPAKWLDVVQLELEPAGQLDIIEVRIFDHENRELLPNLSDRYGWRQLGANAVQLYGLGKPLPAKLDVWFRAHSYFADDPVAELAPSVGAKCKLPGGNFTLRDIRAGSWSYRSGRGLLQLQGDQHQRVTAQLAWKAYPHAGPFQIAAVTKSGEKVHMNGAPQYVPFRTGRREEERIDFNVPLDQIDYFELRRFGGQHVFFFEAVELPAVSTQPFAPPPKAVVDVSGQEMETVLTEFAPFEITVATHRGLWANGTAANGLWAYVMRADEVTEQEQAFTFTYDGEGLSAFAPTFRFVEIATKKPLTFPELKERGRGTAHGAAIDAGYLEFQTPLDRIGSIEVTIGH
jgi:hypothetical protein